MTLMTHVDIDRKALSWVRDEIKQALDRARQALEAFVEDHSATSELDVITENLHQVNGTLKMIGLYGASLLTDEMTQLVEHLRADKVTQQEDAFEVLMRAIVQVPIYLDNLQKGQRDIPIILLPLLNDLRALCGAPLLSEAAFFSPNLNVLPKAGESYDTGNDGRALAKKLRPIYQLSLIGIFRNTDVPENLRRLTKILVQLERQAATPQEQQVWWVCGGLAEALYEEGITLSASVKHLLGAIDRRIKQLTDQGAAHERSPLSTEILKNTLYYVAQATSTGNRVTALNEQFDLQALLPTESELNKAKDGLLGLDGDLIQHVASAIKEDLLQIKEALDIYERSQEKDVSSFAPILDRIKTVADTLGMIGMGRQREELLQHHATIAQALGGTGQVQDTLIMSIASTLIFVESSLASEMSLGNDTDTLLPQSEFNELVRTTAKEAKSVLHSVKDAIATYAADHNKLEILTHIPDQLKSVSGAMAILNQQRGSEMFARLRKIIEQGITESEHVPGAETLNTLADIITGGEYFIDAVVDDPIGADKALDVMADGLARLGDTAPSHATDLDLDLTATPRDDDDGLGFSLMEDVDAAEQESDLELSATPEFTTDDTEITLDWGDDGGAPKEASDAETTQPIKIQAIPESSPQNDNEIDAEVMEIFLEEAEEEATNIANNLRLWRKDTSDKEALTTLRRSFHTIKGSGRIVGANDIGEFAWAIENMLNRTIDKTIPADKNLFTVLEMARDALPQFVEKLKGKGEVTADIDGISAAAHDLTQGRTPTLLGSVSVFEPTDESSTADTLEIDLAALAPAEMSLDDNDAYDISEEMELGSSPALTESDFGEDITLALDETSPEDGGIDPVLAEIFTNETQGHLDTVDAYIDKTIADLGAHKVTHDLIRALHTLHGSANMAGIMQMVPLTDDLEKYAKVKMDDNAAVSNAFLELLHDTTNAIRVLLPNLKMPGAELPDRRSLEQRAHGLLSEPSDAAPKAIDDSAEMEFGEDNSASDMVWDDAEDTDTTMDFSASAAATAKRVTPEVDEELVGIFVEEAEEILAQMESTLQDWTLNPADDESTAQLRRNLHTIKGGARMAGLLALGGLAHEIETLLEEFSRSAPEKRAAFVSLVQNSHDWIVNAVEQIRAGRYDAQPGHLLRQIAELTKGGGTASAPPIPQAVTDVDSSPFDGELIDEVTIEAPDHQHGDIFDLDDSMNATPEVEEISITTPFDGQFVEDEDTGAGEIILAGSMDSDTSFDIDESVIELSADDAVFNDTANVEFNPAEIVLTSPESPPRTSGARSQEFDSELLDIFLEEASEILNTADALIHHWMSDPGDQETIKQLQRALHTMKGGARMAKVAPVGNLSHSIETAMEALQESGTGDPQVLLPLVQASYDWLADAIEKITNNVHVDNPDKLIRDIENALGLDAPEPPITLPVEKKPAARVSKAAAISEPVEELVEISAQPATQDAHEPAFSSVLEAAAYLQEKTVPATTAPAAKATGEVIRVGSDVLEGLINNAGEISIYRSRIDLQLGTITHNLVELEHTVDRIREQLRKFEIEAETQILYRFESVGGEHVDKLHFDPLELDRFSNMQQLSRSLAETVGDLNSIQKYIAGLTRETEILLVQQSRVNSELQNGLMRTRLVPFSSMVPRLRRIVRQTSQELGKEVDFRISGAEGEMDRTVLNRFTPALEHMLRNAIDHGVELPEERKKSKKPTTGTIDMEFSRVGGEFLISIKDDGAGMNLAAIRKKAVERGLMTKTTGLSDNEIVQFVIEAGFSTATKVTQISGRGVGMDVVNTEIKQLGGSLQIETTAGSGTRFNVRLPLTVSVNQALIVLVGEGTYAIPLANIVGVVRLNKQEVEKLNGGKKTHYEYGGNNYQYFHLGTLMNICKPMLLGDKDKVPMILARAGDHRVALLSEAIAGRSEVVVKTVGPQISSVKGISGATIMGDGSVALILDIPNLVRSGLAHIATSKAAAATQDVTTEAAKQPTILVVDDSITVRKVTERLLKRHEMIPITAKDGLDALDKLQDTVPDLILSDIEMPRMDGYEFVINVRRDPRLAEIPVIMITSRTGTKHRERAMEIGANMYMGKPFQDTELLANIEQLLRERK